MVTALPTVVRDRDQRPPLSPLLLRGGEVAELLNISRSKAFEMMQTGELPCVRIGRSVRVPRIALEQWIAARAA